MVEWLGLHTSTAGDLGLIPGWGTKIPQDMWRGQKKKKKFPPKGRIQATVCFSFVLLFGSVDSGIFLFKEPHIISVEQSSSNTFFKNK